MQDEVGGWLTITGMQNRRGTACASAAEMKYTRSPYTCIVSKTVYAKTSENCMPKHNIYPNKLCTCIHAQTTYVGNKIIMTTVCTHQTNTINPHSLRTLLTLLTKIFHYALTVDIIICTGPYIFNEKPKFPMKLIDDIQKECEPLKPSEDQHEAVKEFSATKVKVIIQSCNKAEYTAALEALHCQCLINQ